jgi:hypothetical protein
VNNFPGSCIKSVHQGRILECASHACALKPEAALRVTSGRSLASLAESGSTAPALQMVGAQILDMSQILSSLRFIHNDLIGRRHIVDYKDQHISGRTAQRCLKHATEMVTSIAGVLEKS